MKVEAIPDAQAQISMAEIFLASGNIADARRYFEVVNTIDQEFPRASYYRGVLARLAGEATARDFSSTRSSIRSSGCVPLCSWCKWGN